MNLSSSIINARNAIGWIELDSFDLQCIIGILFYERQNYQKIILNISYSYDFSDAINSESIDDGISYIDIMDLAKDICIKGKFKLLETLVYKVGKAIINKYPKIIKVRVKAAKPDILPKDIICSASIELEN